MQLAPCKRGEENRILREEEGEGEKKAPTLVKGQRRRWRRAMATTPPVTQPSSPPPAILMPTTRICNRKCLGGKTVYQIKCSGLEFMLRQCYKVRGQPLCNYPSSSF